MEHITIDAINRDAGPYLEAPERRKMRPAEKQEGRKNTDERFRLPEVMVIAQRKKPHIFRTVLNGKRYIDITDYFIR